MHDYSHITYSQVATEVLRLADQNPTFVYESPSGNDRRCYYLPKDDQPSGCIFGEALTNLGVKAADLADLECRPIREVLLSLRVTADVPVLQAFTDVQIEQDHHRPWGVAVRLLRARLAVLDSRAKV